jgi:hypothetical protein
LEKDQNTKRTDGITAEENGNGNGENLDELLDLDKHRLSVIPTKKSTPTERWMKYLGFPVAIVLFIWLYYMPAPAGLSSSGQAVIASFYICACALDLRSNTNPCDFSAINGNARIPGWMGMKNVLGVLGFDVIWLNVMAFILSSLLVKTNIAKRIA